MYVYIYTYISIQAVAEKSSHIFGEKARFLCKKDENILFYDYIEARETLSLFSVLFPKTFRMSLKL